MKEFLKKAWPFLTIAASAVPGGNLAMSTLGQVLNVKPADGKSVTWDDLGAAAINATPEVRAQLQAEENRHVEAMQQMGINSSEEFERMATGDRANARNREIQVRDKTPAIGFYIITLGFFGILISLLKWSPPANSRDILNIMLGSLGTAWITAVAYFFGSSAGSAAKDLTINKQAEK
jgi:hypothetical protein